VFTFREPSEKLVGGRAPEKASCGGKGRLSLGGALSYAEGPMKDKPCDEGRRIEELTKKPGQSRRKLLYKTTKTRWQERTLKRANKHPGGRCNGKGERKTRPRRNEGN